MKMSGLESFQTETPDGTSALNYAVRKPLGVVGIITPWNLPLLLLTWKVAPALACGNAVVVKPSEETPATATLLAEAMQDAETSQRRGTTSCMALGRDRRENFLRSILAWTQSHSRVNRKPVPPS